MLAPVPLSDVVCVPAESVTAKLPVRVPVAVGLKATEIPQLAPAASVDPQPFEIVKSPEAVTEVIDTADAVLLLRVTFCAALVVPTVWLAKVRLEGESVTEPPVVLPPVPVRVATSLPADVAMVRVPLNVPVDVGLKTTLVVQLAPAGSVVPHPKVAMANGADAPAPVTVIAELVPLVRTTFSGVLVVPTACEPKFTVVGETLTPPVVAVAPVPDSGTVCVPAESFTFSEPVRVPLALGVKFTEMVQLAPAATLVAHVPPAIPKSPVEAIDVNVTAEAVPFCSVTVCAALVVPTVWLPKVRLDGDNVTDPPPPVVVPPVPVRDTT